MPPTIEKKADGTFDEAGVGSTIGFAKSPVFDSLRTKGFVVMRFCDINNHDTMDTRRDALEHWEKVFKKMGEGVFNKELYKQFMESQAQSTTTFGRSTTVYMPTFKESSFMAMVNCLNPLIQKIVRSPENYRQFSQECQKRGFDPKAGELSQTQKAPHIGAFLVPADKLKDPSPWNENSKEVGEILVFGPLSSYWMSWAENPF